MSSSEALAAFKKTKRVANTSNSKDHFEESVSSHNVVIPTDIWTEFGNIPAVAPINVNALILGNEGTATQAVTAHFQNSLVAVSGNVYAYTLGALINSIPYNWDSLGSYQPILYDNAGTTVIPFDMYDLDHAGGVITFNTLPGPPALPTDLLAGGVPKVSFYQYTGAVGLDAQDVDNLITLETQVAHGFAVGDIVRRSGAVWVPALADSIANASECYMVVEVVAGAPSGSFKASNLGKHTLSVDFTAAPYSASVGDTLYLSSTVVTGQLTKTAPTIKTPIAKLQSAFTVQLFPAVPVDTNLSDDDILVQQATVLAAWKPVYLDAGGVWQLARSDTEVTLATHIVIRAITDVSVPANSWVLRRSGLVSGLTHGLGAVGTKLYTSDITAGVLLSTAPANAIQQVVAQIIDATTLLVFMSTVDRIQTDNEIAVTQAGLVVGDPVYNIAGVWTPANASSLATVATHVVVRADPNTTNKANVFYLSNSGLYTLPDYSVAVTWEIKAGAAGKWLYVGTAPGVRTTLYQPDTSPPAIENRLVYVISGNNVFLHPHTIVNGTTLPGESRIASVLTVGKAYYQTGATTWALANSDRPSTAGTHIVTRLDPLGGASYLANNGRFTINANLTALGAGGAIYVSDVTAGELVNVAPRQVNKLGTVVSVGATSVVELTSTAAYMAQAERFVDQATHGLKLGDGVHLSNAATPIWVRARANSLTTIATHVVTRLLLTPTTNRYCYVAASGDYDLGENWDANEVATPDVTSWEAYAGGKNVPLYLTSDTLTPGADGFLTNANVTSVSAPIRNLLMYVIAGNRVRVNVSQPVDEQINPGETLVTQASMITWVGQAVYNVAGTWAQADARELAKAGTHIVTRVDPLNPTTKVMVAASGVHKIGAGTHGKTIGALHYVSDASIGQLVEIEPLTFSNPIVVPTSTDHFEILGSNVINNARFNDGIQIAHTNGAAGTIFAVGKAVYFDAAGTPGTTDWKLADASLSTSSATHVIVKQGVSNNWVISSHGRFDLGANPPFTVVTGLPTSTTANGVDWATAFGVNTKLYLNSDSTLANLGWLTNKSPVISNQLITVETGNTVFIDVKGVVNGVVNPNRLVVTQAAMVVGEAYYMSGAMWVKAQSDSMATIGTHIVVEADPIATNTFYLIDSGHFTKVGHGLTVGGLVYVSNATAGLLTSTQPDVNQWPRISNPIGIAIDADTIDAFHVTPVDLSLNGTEEYIGTTAFAVGDAIYYTGSVWARALATAVGTLATHVITRKDTGSLGYAASSGVYDFGVFQGAVTWETTFGLNTPVYVSEAAYVVLTRSLTSTAPIYSSHIMTTTSGNLVRIMAGQLLNNRVTHHEFEVTQVAALAVGNAVYFDGTNWSLADSSDVAKTPTHMVVRAAPSHLVNTTYLASTGSHDLGAAHGGAAGNVMYAGTAGALTTTQPDNSTVVGIATGANTIALAFGKLTQGSGTLVIKALHGFYDGAPIRHNGTDWVLALATSIANCATHFVTKVVLPLATSGSFYYGRAGRFDFGEYDKAEGIEDIVNNSGTSDAGTTTWLAQLSATSGARLYLSGDAVAPYSLTPNADFYQQLAVLEIGNVLHLVIGDPIDNRVGDHETLIPNSELVGVLNNFVYHDGTTWVVASNASIDTIAQKMVVRDLGAEGWILSSNGRYTLTSTSGAEQYLNGTGGATETRPIDLVVQVLGRTGIVNVLDLNIHKVTDETFEARGTLGTETGHAFVQGSPIYFDGVNWKLAIANRGTTVATHVVIKDVSANTFLYVSSGVYNFANYNGGGSTWAVSFAVGALLYVSDLTAGLVTSTKPAAESVSNPIMLVQTGNIVHVLPSSHEDSEKMSITVTQTHAFAVGNAIYYEKSVPEWQLARADDMTTVGTHLVYKIETTTAFKAAYGGRVDFGASTLASATPGWRYVSDLVAGELLTTMPDPISNPIGFAESDQVIHIVPMRAVTSGVVESDAAVAFQVNQAHGFTPGTAGQVMYRGSAGWVEAKADAVATVGTHIIGKVIDASNFILISSGFYEIIGYDAGVSASAVVGDWLFVSESTAGGMLKTEGIISNPVGTVEQISGGNTIMNVSFLRAASKGFTSTTVSNDGIVITQAGLGGAADVEKTVFLSTSAGGTWTLADNSSDATLGTHLIVEHVSGNNYKVASSGVATITGHSLGSPGDWIFVGTAGATTNNGAGNYSNPIGIVIDTNTIQMYPMRATQTSSAAAASAGHRWFATANITGSGTGPETYSAPTKWSSDDRITFTQQYSNTTMTTPMLLADSVDITWYHNVDNTISFRLYNNSGDGIYYDIVAMGVSNNAINHSVNVGNFNLINHASDSGEVAVNIMDMTGTPTSLPTSVQVNIRKAS